MSLKETVKMLSDYEYNGEQPIAIVGPDGSDESVLRVYAYGGRIGYIRISDGKFMHISTKGKKAYTKYLQLGEYCFGSNKKTRLNDLSVLKSKYPILDQKNNYEKQFSDMNDKTDINKYLDFIITATYNKQRRLHPDTKDYEAYAPNEKAVQCEITKRFMRGGEKRGWCVCDFEYQDNTYKTEGKIGGRIDLVIYDYKRKQFGLVELKLDNDSTNNIEKHYEDSKNLINNKNVINNIKKRCNALEKAGLIDPINNDDTMWFGFLFVGGKLESSAKLINNRSKVFADKENCRFRYVENIDQLETNGLAFDSMEKFDKFTGKAK